MSSLIKRPVAVVGLLVAGTLLYAAPAAAQATRTWVSGVGDDANPCSRTAPCKTFAGAISKTAAGGEINCIDQGAYGAVTITKSIALSCVGVTAGVLHSSTNGIVINAAATDNIFIKGLDINGSPPTSPGLNGIRFLAGASLTVEDTIIRGATGASPNGYGITFNPSGASRLSMTRVTIQNAGSTSANTGGGILINPTGTGSAQVAIDTVQIVQNGGVGVLITTNGNTGGPTTFVSIANSTISGNQFGVGSISVPGTKNVMTTIVNSTMSSQTVGYGILSNGAGAQTRVSGSRITNNVEGIKALNGGFLISYGDNLLFGNTTDGTWTTTLTKS